MHAEPLSRWPWRESCPTCKGLSATVGPVAQASMRETVVVIASVHGLSYADIIGPSRRREIARARFEAMSLIHKTGRYSLPQIGRFFHRDHTTVLHGIRRHAELKQEAA